MLKAQQARQGFIQLCKDTSGNVTVMAAITLVALLAAAGSAVDYVRWTNAKTELNAAMDGAVLAGTQALLEKGKNEKLALRIANTYFKGMLGNSTKLRTSRVKFKLNSKGNGLAAYGQAEIETTMLKLVGINKLPLLPKNAAEVVSAEAGMDGPGGNVEISVMLDVTGSMCDDGQGPCNSGSKIDGLKSAAKTLVDTVIWKDQSKYTSRVALVPFSTRIRVAPDGGGGSMMQQLTNLPPTWSGYYNICTSGSGSGGSETNGNWTCSKSEVQYMKNWKVMPCVTDRFYNASNNIDYSDHAPGANAWFNAHGGDRMPQSFDSSSTAATTNLGKTAADPAYHWNYDPDGGCADVPQNDVIQALTNDKTLLKSKIDALEAYGSTAGALGTAFSWFMLSPDWSSIWTGASTPKPYSMLQEKSSSGAPKLRKIAILMTDGAYNTYRGWKDQDVKQVTDYARGLCTKMKDKGVEIYTVGFDLKGLPANDKAHATNMLRFCASKNDQFFDASNSKELVAAFKSIGEDVTETATRLVK